jgi:putative phosphoribosyl transferase
MWPPEHERFENRSMAGRALGAGVSAHLGQLRSRSIDAVTSAPLVLALPRGGVPVGLEVAKAINAEFDIIIVRKIGLPWQPDFGVGAIAEDGPPVFDRDALAGVGLSTSDLAPAVQRERLELRRRQERYRSTRPAPDAFGRVVVIVDDGLATGVTVRAAVRALRTAHPAYIMVAAPVCAAECVDWLAEEADAVLDIQSPRDFHALGLYYRNFHPLTEHDVQHILADAWGAAAKVST